MGPKTVHVPPDEPIFDPIFEFRPAATGTSAARPSARRAHLRVSGLFVLAYLVLAGLSYLSVDPVQRDSIVWLPAGLCTAFLTVRGRTYWPAIMLATIVDKLLFQSEISLTGVLVNASGNAIEALVGSSLLRWLHFDFRLNRLRDVLLALGIVCVGCGVISVGFGMVRRVISEPNIAGLLHPAVIWWLGNSSAALLLAPLLLTWSQPVDRNRFQGSRFEATGLGIGTVGMTLVAIGWAAKSSPLHGHVIVLLLPILLASVLKFGRHGATGVMFLAGVSSIVAATIGWGVFHGMAFPDRLWFVWVLLLEGMISSLSLAAVLVERDSARESLTRSEQRFRSLFEDTSDAVIVVDFSGTARSNLAARRLFGPGLPAGESGDDILLAFPPDGGRRDCALRTIDGRTIQGDVGLTQIRTDEGMLLQLVVRDVTKRRQSEAALLQAKQQAESVGRAKDELLSVASHELRTPLGGIIGLAELAELQSNDPDMVATARLIGASGHRMLGLVNNIMLLAEIEAGSVQARPRPVDLRDVVTAAGRRFQASADGRGLRLQVDTPPGPVPAVTDAELVGRLLDPIVENAIKFTECGSVTVSVAAGDEGAVVTVSDTGAGIAPEIRGRLFQAFAQGDMSRSRRHEGAGLGLAVAGKLAGLLGGRIDLGDLPTGGNGTVVRIHLPPGPVNGPDLAEPLVAD